MNQNVTALFWAECGRLPPLIYSALIMSELFSAVNVCLLYTSELSGWWHHGIPC